MISAVSKYIKEDSIYNEVDNILYILYNLKIFNNYSEYKDIEIKILFQDMANRIDK